ncbi:MAG: bifunctional 5,10-methylenetetrahydrofolate dehydrogenase/5,10-methenyltetrahydrofolate cyclohydrolase [Bacteroidetes bacterium]|nr:bifunctional 5,10-methylenetetrahydrofolate dehydrogenase/5,10-methenyltetrahydrofolate cyclohydrolase [Bacteroidota bacterium]MBS1629712.1 bifunctional 5,10-methylenetetrahydrofolate dehydrogenase/5,10-methenyltetrahydrofolate cyclohydrolase [Bacteroidota bacterium]
MQILDGAGVSEQILQGIRVETAGLLQQGNRAPHLAAILVGDNPASQVYVGSKVRTCESLGFSSTLLRLPADVPEEKLLEAVRGLNEDARVDGILVQLPLPKHISEAVIIHAIDPRKDVDGFHPVSQGKMLLSEPTFLPATPYGILLLLQHYGISPAGMHAVVIGRSHIVGTPMSVLLSRNAASGNATVTLTHSRTKDLKALCLQADLIVAAIGQPRFLKEDMVREGAIVIDVGINRIPDATRKSGSRLVGDVDFDSVAPKCSWITPVPKGVGPMTICGLMKNTLQAWKQAQSKPE